MNITPVNISVIVTTYRREEALRLVLQGLQMQDTKGFEVVVADDGSEETTAHLIETFQSTIFSIKHVWQPDEGYQAAKIRNKAVAAAKGDYLIFIDGDCIPQSSFVRRHLQLSENKWFVSGNRILLNETLTHSILEKDLLIQQWSLVKWIWLRAKGSCNRILPLISLPLGHFRKYNSEQWKGVKTCNLGVWKHDFLQVNGFDETYTGWGYEDSDLVIRLLRNGVKRKEGRFSVPVFHLWHRENDRSRENENLIQLQTILKSKDVKAVMGVNQYREINYGE